MVRINKEEAEYIRANCKGVGIVRTCRQKSDRHNYYVEESGRVMSALNRFRNRNVKKIN